MGSRESQKSWIRCFGLVYQLLGCSQVSEQLSNRVTIFSPLWSFYLNVLKPQSLAKLFLNVGTLSSCDLTTSASILRYWSQPCRKDYFLDSWSTTDTQRGHERNHLKLQFIRAKWEQGLPGILHLLSSFPFCYKAFFFFVKTLISFMVIISLILAILPQFDYYSLSSFLPLSIPVVSWFCHHSYKSEVYIHSHHFTLSLATWLALSNGVLVEAM